jgi:urease subunit gamma/beta
MADGDQMMRANTASILRGTEFGAARAGLPIDVLNTGSHPVRVRSAAHFYAVHRALKFDRAATYGMRLDCPAGADMRFEPGEIVRVNLVPMGESGLAHSLDRQTGALVHPAEVRRRGLRHA